jgi:hypothetical protein
MVHKNRKLDRKLRPLKIDGRERKLFGNYRKLEF